MFAIIGLVIVFGSVIGGFILEGGPILVLMQWVEFIIIGGAAIGALLISAPTKVFVKIISKAMATFKGAGVSRDTYLELLRLMYEIFQIIRKDGLIALEAHVEKPKESPVFKKYPKFLANGQIMRFITDTLRLLVMGGISPHEVEMLLDVDIEVHQQEGARPVMILQKIGDSMPGLGIVAAVLGVIITMQYINGPPEQIGHKIAAAMVGTFIGILLSYGFVQPLATNIELANEDESKLFEVIKSGIITTAKGYNPIIAIEFARRIIPEDMRPSFQEMEKYVKNVKQ